MGGLRYQVLGPLAVDRDGVEVPLGGPRRRTLAALLLLDAGRPVPTDLLVRALWADDPPDTATAQVHNQVWRLRRALGAVVRTEPGGYRLDAGPGELDAQTFTGLVTAGREHAAADPARAADLLGRALACWRGPAAVPELAAAEVRARAAELGELRTVVAEERADALIRLGRHRELLAELRQLVDAEPLRESSRALLMVALHRDGRRAEALAAYREGHSRLAAELGLDPAPALVRLHERILTGDPTLDDPADGPAPPAPAAQLPAAPADFVGRRAEVAAVLAGLATGPAGSAGAPPLVVLSGAAGVGKTALALHAAARLRERAPDGQLYVRLGGGAEPLDPADVLARFLRALGEDPRTMPAGTEERAALFRARTDRRRLLVLLDDAAGEAQVRPLLPAGAGCRVLVTSRQRLAALDGVRHVEVGLFGAAEGVELVRRIIGPGRADAEPLEVARLVERCGGLPLAVRVAGARLVARPHWPVARLAELLADERHRLDELATGDLAVRPSLALSHRALDPTAGAGLRLLGTLDVPDFAGWVMAPLLELPLPAAEEVVERLVEARLLEAGPAGPGGVRYRFHDLVRSYARELATAEPDGAAEAAAARRRAYEGWLALADVATAGLAAGFQRIDPGDSRRWAVGPDLRRQLVPDPLAWCEAERVALVAVVGQAAADGCAGLARDLACTLARFLELREHLDEWRAVTVAALAAVRAAGDPVGEAHLLRSLGELHLDRDRYAEAVDCFDRALALLAEHGGPGAQVVLRGLGTAHRLRGDTAAAADCLRRSLALAEQRDDGPGQVRALHGLGVLDRRLGDTAAAVRRYRAALDLLARRSDPFAEAYVLDSLGLALGDDPAAERHLARSVELCRQVGYRRGEALVLGHLGEWHRRAGADELAGRELAAALAACRSVGERPGEVLALHRLGLVHRGRGERAAALHRFGAAARLAGELGLADDQAAAQRLHAEVAAAEVAAVPGRRAGGEAGETAAAVPWGTVGS